MLQKICIVVTAFDRKKQTEISLVQLKKCKGINNQLWVYNDGSREYDSEFLSRFADRVFTSGNIGIEEQRKSQLLYFNNQNDFDFLYFTDNDVFYDPDWLSKIGDLYHRYKVPISLYNTEGHEKYTIEEYEDCYLRGSLPGVSILLDRDMVKFLVKDIIVKGGLFARKGGFDWRIGELFGRVITSKQSYLEHYGYNGLHSKLNINGDWALNPTPYLESFKPSLISYFQNAQIDNNIKEIFDGLE